MHIRKDRSNTCMISTMATRSARETSSPAMKLLSFRNLL